MLHVRLNAAHAANLANLPARSVTIATDLGMMQILPGHLSLVGTVTASPVIIATEGSKELTYLVRNAVLTIGEGEAGETLVTVAAQLAEKKDEVSIETLQSFREKMHNALEKKEDLSSYQIDFLTEQLDAVDQAITIHKS
jgi:F0F1-type ATP synthase epsilon subunit